MGLLKTVVKLGETNKTTCMLGAYVSYIRWFCDESIEISKYLFATMAQDVRDEWIFIGSYPNYIWNDDVYG